MNKRGQFFLVAAIIVISIFVSLAAAVNTISVGEKREYYHDLAEQVNYESKKVSDYGVYTLGNDVILSVGDGINDKFLDNYAKDIANDEVIFLYGGGGSDCNQDTPGEDVYCAIYYSDLSLGVVGLDTGGGVNSVPIQRLGSKQASVILNGNVARIEIDDNTDGLVDRAYEFEIKEGINFYHIIAKNNEDEKIVTER